MAEGISRRSTSQFLSPAIQRKYENLLEQYVHVSRWWITQVRVAKCFKLIYLYL